MSALTATTLISAHGAIWNYPGCWHQMYCHINKSTWFKCWRNVKLMLCSVTLGHQMPILVGVCLMTGQPDPKTHQMSSWHLTECQPDWKAHQMSRWPGIVLLLATRCLYWGGLKIIKMAWDLCSSPPCIPFYPYTMFQNPMSKPSCQKTRKTLISQKVLVIQSSNIVHCDWHTQNPICAHFQAFSNTFFLFKLMFFFNFLSGGVQ